MVVEEAVVPMATLEELAVQVVAVTVETLLTEMEELEH